MISSYLKFAHSIWKNRITSQSYVIDATCGNGYDSHFILMCKPAHLFAIDIQKPALTKTKIKLQNFKNFSLHQTCHSKFLMVHKPVNLIVYNLGYLPGGYKGLTTQKKTTLSSITSGLKILSVSGLMSIMVYPKHSEGEQEFKAILSYVSKINRKKFNIMHHQWLRDSKSPSLFLIEKNPY